MQTVTEKLLPTSTAGSDGVGLMALDEKVPDRYDHVAKSKVVPNVPRFSK